MGEMVDVVGWEGNHEGCPYGVMAVMVGLWERWLRVGIGGYGFLPSQE